MLASFNQDGMYDLRIYYKNPVRRIRSKLSWLKPAPLQTITITTETSYCASAVMSSLRQQVLYSSSASSRSELHATILQTHILRLLPVLGLLPFFPLSTAMTIKISLSLLSVDHFRHARQNLSCPYYRGWQKIWPGHS